MKLLDTHTHTPTHMCMHTYMLNATLLLPKSEAVINSKTTEKFYTLQWYKKFRSQSIKMHINAVGLPQKR